MIPPSGPPPPPPRRVLSRGVKLMLRVLGVLILIPAGLAALLELPVGVRWVAQAGVDWARPLPGARLRVGGARGGFLTGVELLDLSVVSASGRSSAHIDTLRIAYLPAELFGRPLRVRSVRVARLSVTTTPDFELLRARSGGHGANTTFALDLDHVQLAGGSMAIVPSASSATPAGLPDLAGARATDGEVQIRGLHVRGAAVAFDSTSLRALLFAPGDSLSAATLSARAALEPGWLRDLEIKLDGTASHLEVDGSLAVPTGHSFSLDHTDLSLRLAPLASSDLRRLIPTLERAADLTVDMKLSGQGDSAAFSAGARSSDGGHLEAIGQASLADPHATWARLHAGVTDLDLGSWSAMEPRALVLAGGIEAHLGGPDAAHWSGPVELSLDASGAKSKARPVHVHATARFTDGEASLRADAQIERFAFHAAGTARPLGPRLACDLDLVADVPPVSAPWWRGHGLGRPLLAGRLIGAVRAQRDSSAPASGAASIRFEPDQTRRAVIGPARFDATLADSRIEWRTRLSADGGTLDAHGNLRTGEPVRYAISSAEAHALPLGELLADSLASTLDAKLSLAGRGFSPATANVEGRVAPLIVTRGPHVAHLDSLRFALHGGRLEAHTHGALDGAVVDGRGWLHPITPPLRAAGVALRFEGLDGSRFTSDSLLESRLNGTLECTLSAPDLAEWTTPTAVPAARAAAAQGTLHLRLEPSGWRHDRVASCSLDAALAHGAVHYDGRLEATFGSVSWSGDARPFGRSPEARLSSLTFEDVDLAQLLAAPMPHTRLGGEIHVAGAGASVDSLDAQWGASLDGSNIGNGRFGRLRFGGSLVRGALDARFEADDGPDSVLARLAAQVRRGSARQRWAVSGRFQGGARFGGSSLDTVSGEFAFEDGMLRLPRVVIAGNVMELSARGRVALGSGAPADSTDLRVSGSIRELGPLGSRLGVEPLDAGTGAFTMAALGPRDAMTLTASLIVTRLKANRTRVDSLDIRATALARGDSIIRAQAHAYAHGLVPDGLQERNVEARLSWNGRELGLDGHAQLNIGGTQDLALRLEPGAGITRLSLDRLEMERGSTRFELERPAVLLLAHNQLAVDHLGLMQNGRRCLLASGAVRDDSSSVLEVSLDSLDIVEPLAWTGLPGMRGRVSASARLRGPRRDPVVDGWLRGTLATERGRWARLDGDLAWRRDSLGAGLRFAQSDHQWIRMRMLVPLSLNLDPQPGERVLRASEGDFSQSLESSQLDLAWFEPLISPRLVRKLSGRMDGSVYAKGSTLRPDFSGELHVRHARALIPALATTFESKDLGLHFQHRSIVLGPSVVTAGGGRLELNGQATLEGPGHRTFDARVAFSEFRFMNTALAKVELNGELRAEGRLGSPDITGTLEMANSTLYAESGSNDRKLERVELSEDDWRELDARFSEADVSAAIPFTGFSDSIRTDVTVKVGRNVWVRRRSDPIVALELTGQVRATRQRGESPQLAGRIEVETGRSYLSFLNRRFDLTRARVDLPGPIPDASAELEAQYLPGSSGTGGSSGAKGPDVTALVTLGAEGARVDLHSTPYMEHAALVNYLATGETQGEMSSGTAYGLAVGSVLGTVGGSAGRSLGLDVVQVTQDAYGGQTLSAGSHVKPQLYLGFRQPVVEGSQSSSRGETGTYTTEFEVEVEAGKRMLMNVQGGGSQYRFLLRPRLGK